MVSKVSASIKVYKHTQATASKTWTVTHNLDTTAPVVECWVDVEDTVTKIIPSEIKVINRNKLTIRFLKPYLGAAFVKKSGSMKGIELT